MNQPDYSGISKSLSIPDLSLPLHSESIKKKPKFEMIPIEENEEKTEEFFNTDESPLPEKEFFLSKEPINKGIDYNFMMNYKDFPTIFDSIPTKIEDDEDDADLWGTPLVKYDMISRNFISFIA